MFLIAIAMCINDVAQVNVTKGELAWTVYRRYQDFEKLHTTVKR